MSFRAGLMVVAAAGALALATGARAAAPPAAAAAATAPTPRTADGHPDLTGLWRRQAPAESVVGRAFQNRAADTAAGGTENIAQVREGNYNYEEVDAEFIVKSGQDMPHYKPEYWEQVRTLEENAYRRPADPQYGCKNQGVVRLAYPEEIFQSPNKVTLLYVDAIPWFREIPIGGKTLPSPDDFEGLRPTGVSVAHWEGDTLVVETVDFPSDGVWYSTRGWIGTPEAKVTERFHRVGDRMTYDMTVDDPAFTRPWVRPTETLVIDRTGLLQEPLTCIEKDGPYLPPSQ